MQLPDGLALKENLAIDLLHLLFLGLFTFFFWGSFLYDQKVQQVAGHATLVAFSHLHLFDLGALFLMCACSHLFNHLETPARRLLALDKMSHRVLE